MNFGSANRVVGRLPTRRQLRVLRMIHQMTAKRGFPPRIAEIAEALGVVQTAVREHYKLLAKRGLIHWEIGVARSVVVTPEGLKALKKKAFRVSNIPLGAR